MKVRQKEIFEGDDLVRIEFTKEDGEHLFDALWDPRDEQNEENRVEFRKWSYRMVEQQGHKLT